MTEKRKAAYHSIDISTLTNSPPLIHPDLEKYNANLPLNIKVMIESHTRALEDVNQMVFNGMVSDEVQFQIEFTRRLQEHQVRLRGYWQKYA